VSLKQLIVSWLGNHGLQVFKAPKIPYTQIPVFQLAVEWLSKLRGDELKFIQVGANDGLFGDPLHHYIVNRPWRGVLVEPQPDVFERLVENLSQHSERLKFENVAIGDGGTALTLYRAPAPSIKSMERMPRSLTVTSSNPRIVTRQTGVPEKDLVKLTVPSVTLDELADRHGLTEFDILQVDVEGYDLHVLKTLSLKRFRPGLIQFEHGHLSRTQLSEAVSLLSDHDYVINHGGRKLHDTIAMPRELFRF
jgi:FkbM family methyltransferase